MFELNEASAVELACGIQGWMNREELAWLYREAGKLRPGELWVEVGCWKGRSALATGLGLPQNGGIRCVDNWRGNEGSQVMAEAAIPGWLFSCVENNVRWLLNKLRPDVEVSLMSFPSAEAAAAFSTAGVAPPSAVFIDASHDYASVRADIAAWRSVLPSGGLLAGHDYASDHPGVMQAVQEAFPSFENPKKTAIWAWRKP